MSVHDGNYRQAKKALGIPHEEPIFVIRAQDKLSGAVLARYRNFAEVAGCDQEFLSGLDVVMMEFQNWQSDNSTKQPD